MLIGDGCRPREKDGSSSRYAAAAGGDTVGFACPAQFFAPLSFCKESGIQTGLIFRFQGAGRRGNGRESQRVPRAIADLLRQRVSSPKPFVSCGEGETISDAEVFSLPSDTPPTSLARQFGAYLRLGSSAANIKIPGGKCLPPLLWNLLERRFQTSKNFCKGAANACRPQTGRYTTNLECRQPRKGERRSRRRRRGGKGKNFGV